MDLTNFNAEQARSLIKTNSNYELNAILNEIYIEALAEKHCLYYYGGIRSEVYAELQARGFTLKYNDPHQSANKDYTYIITW